MGAIETCASAFATLLTAEVDVVAALDVVEVKDVLSARTDFSIVASIAEAPLSTPTLLLEPVVAPLAVAPLVVAPAVVAVPSVVVEAIVAAVQLAEAATVPVLMHIDVLVLETETVLSVRVSALGAKRASSNGTSMNSIARRDGVACRSGDSPS